MIDLHSHILCDIDDGSKSLHESVGLCKKAVKNDIFTIIATPHFECGENVEFFLKKRNREFEILQNELIKENINVEMYLGAEIFLNNDIFEDFDAQSLTINNSRYLLCEFLLAPFDPDIAIMYTQEVIAKGLVPIIAHPERYITFYENQFIIDELAEIGAFFQVNMDSLAGAGGEELKDFATRLVVEGTADFIGTDAHSLNFRPNDFLDKQEFFDRRITKRMLTHCLNDAPLMVINNQKITR